jgi:hypothetical protein
MVQDTAVVIALVPQGFADDHGRLRAAPYASPIAGQQQINAVELPATWMCYV